MAEAQWLVINSDPDDRLMEVTEVMSMPGGVLVRTIRGTDSGACMAMVYVPGTVVYGSELLSWAEAELRQATEQRERYAFANEATEANTTLEAVEFEPEEEDEP